jgi:hypothetical protein
MRRAKYYGATFVPKDWDMVSQIKKIAGEIREDT